MINSRRRFLIQFVAGISLAATGRMFWVESEEFVPELLLNDGDSWLILEPDDRLILAVITPVLLQGVMNTPLAGEKLVSYLKDFDKALSLLGGYQQREFKELLSVLHSMIGRIMIAGVWTSWNQASAETIENMLNSWRNSYLSLMKVAYAGLKELSYASWYGNPEHWQDIGYPGPPEINRQ